MISFIRSYKRPHQQALLAVWGCILCLWLIISVHRTASPSSSHPNTRNKKSSFSGQLWTSIQEPLKNQHGKAASSKLLDRPLPFPGSQPDFQNVPVVTEPVMDEIDLNFGDEVSQYINSIWDLGDSRFWRTECDGQGDLPKRYTMLKDLANHHQTSEVKYFFALDLHQVKDLLPRLMGTLVQVTKILGPEKCAVSIVEGRSTDGSFAILEALQLRMEEIGVRYHLVQSDINPKADGVDRIEALSELRNLALQPLIDGSRNGTGPPIYDHDTIITFINDVALCPEDIYELIFQHVFQSAHQTCAMDWVFGGDVFYDSWVSRSMSGDLFFEVPQDVSFSYAKNMFWDHQLTKRKFANMQPFQVFSCWGGMVTLDSAPFISGQIKIRRSKPDECYAGEPVTLASDLWRLGYGKILTVPSVNVGYNSPESSRIKKRRGWVHKHVETDKTEEEWKGTELIEWKTKPPGQIKCMPGWGDVSWTEP